MSVRCRLIRWAAITFGLGLMLAPAAVLPAAAEDVVVRAVMHSPLRVTDPTLTTAYITRNHGYMIYDTLLGTDENFVVRPQMADWTVSEDGLVYTFVLRDGLRWHDGEPVTARDCVASIERWAARDGLGQLLMEYTESLAAVDERTLVLELDRPVSFVVQALGKLSAYPPFMLPERIARTPPDEPIPEHTGSGPFRFVTEEFEPGVRAVYARNEDYVPRDEPASWTAGGKVVNVDRVEWIVMPDPQTQIAAIMSGEIDMIEDTPFDLLPLFDGHSEIEIRATDPLGFQIGGRMNFLHPPFDRVEVRRAAMRALYQTDFLHALVGDARFYRPCGAMFGCGTPLETDVGAAPVLDGDDMEAARRKLAASGYDGSPVVILQPTDVTVLRSHPLVAAQQLRRAGFNVDLRASDWQTVISRRASQAHPSDGGWSMFFTLWSGSDIVDPLFHQALIARGTQGGWFGWPEDETLEGLRAAYAEAVSDADRRSIAHDIQARAYDRVIHIPLGQFMRQTSWRHELTGVLDSPVPVFWSMEKR